MKPLRLLKFTPHPDRTLALTTVEADAIRKYRQLGPQGQELAFAMIDIALRNWGPNDSLIPGLRDNGEKGGA